MPSQPPGPLVSLARHLQNTGQSWTDDAGTVAGVPGIDLADERTGGLPVDADDGLGTAVAGAVVADNGIGSAGVAYDATIVSVRHDQNDAHDLKDDAIGRELVKAFGYRTRIGVDVSNNSWGPDEPSAVDADLQAAIQRFATQGLGGVVVFAAGNERAQTLSANLEGDENSPYAIPVAPVDQTGKFSVFSSQGANILVAAPGENIQTTARVGTGDDHGNYTLADGTSFATPNVAGVAASIIWRRMARAVPRAASRSRSARMSTSRWRRRPSRAS